MYQFGDPYNSKQHQQGSEGDRLQELQEIMSQAAQAYDSMSTILEVDSEETSEASLTPEPRSAATGDRSKQEASSIGKNKTQSHRKSSEPAVIEREDDSLKSYEQEEEEDDDDEDKEVRLGKFQRNVASSTASGRAAGLLGRVSPVGSGRWGPENEQFSGTLSVLAKQVERLRHKADREADRANREVGQNSTREDSQSDNVESPAHSKSQRDHNEEVSDEHSTITRSPSATSSSSHDESDSTRPKTPAPPETNIRSATHIPTTTTSNFPVGGSAESLMMITLSPMLSPSRRDLAQDEPRKVVEVSNKSTETAIDSRLMEKMVQKYFIETKDQASQSIDFDCLDEFEQATSGGSAVRSIGRNSSSTRHVASGHAPRPPTKSVGVGTEKFSRERFSLLPDTKTRSTQTAPNMIDFDRGASDTRLFKLNHLDLIRPKNVNAQVSQALASNSREDSDQLDSLTNITGPVEASRRKSPSPAQQATSNPATTSPKPSSLAQRNLPATPTLSSSPNISINSTKAPEKPPKLANISSQRQVTIQEKPEIIDDENGRRTTENHSDDSLVNQPQNTSSQRLQDNVNLNITTINNNNNNNGNDTEKQTQIAQIQQQDQPRLATIPSVKTELRLVIEVKNSRERQFTDLKSESLLRSDGKLFKTTDISTRKHVCMSPGQVLNKLHDVGRAHSLALSQQQQQKNVDYHDANYGYNHNYNHNYRGEDQHHWRQVSESSVRNEIETDTRHKSKHSEPRRHRDQHSSLLAPSNSNMDEILILSSDARIGHHANDKSSIELSSKASRKSPKNNGEEVTLVQSEAAFDERDYEARINNEKILSPRSPNRTAFITQQPANMTRGPDPPLNFRGSSDSHFEGINLIDSKSRKETPTPPPPIPPKHTRRVLPRGEPATLRPKDREMSLSMSRLELGEERENRRSMLHNGQLIYDDRISERRFETRNQPNDYNDENQSPLKTTTPKLPPKPMTMTTTLAPPKEKRYIPSYHSDSEDEAIQKRLPLRSVSLSPSSPLDPGAKPLRSSLSTRPQQQQRQEQQQQRYRDLLLARSSPQLMMAEQTSQLSSDRETMDSGFGAQSGAGGPLSSSGSGLNRTLTPTLSPPLQFRRSNSSNSTVTTKKLTRSSSKQTTKTINKQYFSTKDLIDNDEDKDGAGEINYSRTRIFTPRTSASRDNKNKTNRKEPDSQSLTFMDDSFSDQSGEDDFVRQMGGSQPTLAMPQAAGVHTTFAQKLRSRAFTPIPNWRASTLQPPPAFRGEKTPIKKQQHRSDSLIDDYKRPASPMRTIVEKDFTKNKLERSTELTTLLSRLKPSASQSSISPKSLGAHQPHDAPDKMSNKKQRTQTRLEQTISGSSGQETDQTTTLDNNNDATVGSATHRRPSRIRTHIMFESDSDSLTGSGRSSSANTTRTYSNNNISNKLQKKSSGKSELVTKTKYYSQQPNNDDQTDNRCRRENPNSQGNDYDYSLCVDRVRDEKVEKRVNTFIKHSRLIKPS